MISYQEPSRKIIKRCPGEFHSWFISGYLPGLVTGRNCQEVSWKNFILTHQRLFTSTGQGNYRGNKKCKGFHPWIVGDYSPKLITSDLTHKLIRQLIKVLWRPTVIDDLPQVGCHDLTSLETFPTIGNKGKQNLYHHNKVLGKC